MPNTTILLIAAPAVLLAAGPAWLAALGGRVETGAAGEITAVDLRASWVTDGDLLDLARLPALRRLDLSRTRITDQGLSYLKQAAGMEEVNLAFAEKIGDPAHATVQQWKKLRRLTLRGTVIADETAAAAARLPGLESLDIADTIVGDVGIESLSLAPKLRELAIGNTRISELGYQSLRQFTTLETLDLSGGRHRGPATLNEQSVEAVASLRQLRVLRLGHTKFPAKSMAVLRTLENLERLGLEYSPEVNDDAIPHLIAWRSLRVVDLHGTKVTAEGAARLRAARPDCRVLWE
ncbi:MAG: hypothetical protein IPM24_16980 [Bryobacterales bacterium]|nr:hypothetical protein [Bryobacterales bacterium]